MLLSTDRRLSQTTINEFSVPVLGVYLLNYPVAIPTRHSEKQICMKYAWAMRMAIIRSTTQLLFVKACRIHHEQSESASVVRFKPQHFSQNSFLCFLYSIQQKWVNLPFKKCKAQFSTYWKVDFTRSIPFTRIKKMTYTECLLEKWRSVRSDKRIALLRVALALTRSTASENYHFSLPTFISRMRDRVKGIKAALLCRILYTC